MTKKSNKQVEKATNRFIRSIRLRSILSFGPDSEEIELQPLNVLIGPNASGKSNLIAAISLLKAAPVDLLGPFLEGEGSVQEWLWQGKEGAVNPEIEATIDYPDAKTDLRYQLSFTCDFTSRRGLQVVREHISPKRSGGGFFYKNDGQGLITYRVRTDKQEQGPEGPALVSHVRTINSSEISSGQCILRELRHPRELPEIKYLADQFIRMQLYRKWEIGPECPARKHQGTDQPGDFLHESANNLAMVINRLPFAPELEERVRRHFQKFSDHMGEVIAKMDFGTASVFVKEWGDRMIPARRLSDGTLRYLCLLVILCHPEPPPLICIEEPELGLHPDMIGNIAELLVEASKRTQLIVTTHSDVLVSALSETPESILVCEQDAGGTKMRRLEKERLGKWLQRYSLGDLWRKGVVGGNRW